MADKLPYFAFFYSLGLILMALFIRLYLNRKREKEIKGKKSSDIQ